MKSFYRILTVIIVVFVVIFLSANLLLHYSSQSENGRPYRVEINRLALQIAENGLENVDLSECTYVTNITEFGNDFYSSPNDYIIREINDNLYRFDYSAENIFDNSLPVLIVNIVLGAAAAVVIVVLLYIRTSILLPFERLKDLPYELSKGNLTTPLKENKSRFFGKFLWGMNQLRENMEQQKRRELELQRERKTLLLSLSHDIKTPLSAIKLYAKALSKNLYTDPQRQREIAENINAKADEIEGYVSEIVTASREDFLSLEVENGEFYLSDLMESIVVYYSEKLTLTKTEFLVGGYRNRLLFGNLDRSIEVLQNVIENAQKYGDGRRIELLFSEEDEGVLVAVRNHGCTLEKEELPYIFESFWRGKNSENISGSGLGLYICRQLMHKMNGEIFATIDNEVMTVTALFGRA
ncbi:MAG: HAMP domain-containing histidine kinase [Lachnospiraceae bacterium]|nr:HAMP domain-containing histidine kinase [Lachnospiraceae bacterium]